MIGVSNVSVAELERARTVADIVSVQNRYSVGDRRSNDVMERCQRDGIAFFHGFRSGRAGSRERRNMRGWQIRTARPRHRWRSRGSFSARRMMLPIPGTSSLTHLEENVAAAALRLSEGEVAHLTG